MKRTLQLIASSALLLALTACRAPDHGHTAQAAAPMELKIYAVPPEQTGKLGEALGNALGKMANVTMPAPGKLLVYAPRDAQVSIDAAIASLGQSASPEQASAQVNLRFWVVDAETGPGTDDPTLKPLSATLDSVRQSMGPLHFQLDQAVAAMASVGHNSTIRTATDGGYPRAFDFNVNTVNGNTINLFLLYDDNGQSGLAQFKTQIDTQSGQYQVLAQAPGACAAALPGKTAPPCPVKPALRLLIVRADRLNPPA